MENKIYLQAQRYCWALLVLILPITSFPPVAKMIGSGTTVAAPSALVLLILVIGWLLPYLINGGSLPQQSLPLIVFAVAALAMTALSFFLHIPPYKENSTLRNQMEALLTLGIGISFFLLTASWAQQEERTVFTLRLLNWSGLVMLLWCLVQAAAWYSLNRYPLWLRTIHEWYSVGPLFRQRVSGFALEPSWLAHQLNMLYLPLWLSFSARRYSVHKFRLLGLSFENVLLIGGALALFLTLSRVGLLAFLLMLTYLLFRAGIHLKNWFTKRASDKWSLLAKRSSLPITALIYALLILILIAATLGMAYGLSRFDPRMAKLFQIDLARDNALLYYANQLTFASRLVYWQAGWQIFSEHPWTGVGLGNAGFFMTQKISGYGWSLMEIRELVYRTPSLLNIKSLWVRLLAETGMIGFILFVSWLYVLWRCATNLNQHTYPLYRGMGLFGIFVLLGLLIEGFSVDSFAMPYAWFSLGLLTAAHERGWSFGRLEV
ncbi:MAG: O-antigen ligase family protein [Anaerolineae bacterium]|nr:O-antigen ligase family protein [Anaerolineae bacterium]